MTDKSKYTITILHEGELEVEDDNTNVDVDIQFADGRRHCPTFFTTRNIATIMKQHERTGECASGLYLWASDMIIIRHLSREAIETAVAELVESGELFQACKLLSGRK